MNELSNSQQVSANAQPGSPTPEEVQKQMADFVRQHFQGIRMTFGAKATPVVPAEPSEEPKPSSFRFDRKPREVKAYLDRFVIKQEEAKKVLSVAICDHYHHVRLSLDGKEQPNYAKQNILLLGPTGVG